MNQSLALIQGPVFRQEYERVPSKYRSQISRKTLELQNDPTPGGSRTSLKGYSRLCRLRAGDFRIIYAYDDKVVQLMNLRRRDERTYDKLDEQEIVQFEPFREITGENIAPKPIPNWEDTTAKWNLPKKYEDEALPQPITPIMLDKLEVPEQSKQILIKVKTVDELLDCQQVLPEHIEKVLDTIYPKTINSSTRLNIPITDLSDLIDATAAAACGPIIASEVSSNPLPEEIPESKSDPVHKTIPLVVQSTWRNESMKPYRGNTSRGIPKDTRYTITHDGDVRLQYSIGRDEKALLTTDAHPELVAMVNEAKHIGGNAQGGGSFAINEFRHVLVPTTTGTEVLFAGTYTRDLEFDFNGTIISPVAPRSIRPGQEWPGPHVGIKYTLAAGATDVRYESTSVSGKAIIQKTIKLTNFHSGESLAGLLSMLKAIKPTGGAIYINEARELFAPIADQSGDYKRVYIGHLGKNPWFPNSA